MKKRHLSLVGYLLIIFVFIFTGLFLIYKGSSDTETVLLTYEENNKIDYNVCYTDSWSKQLADGNCMGPGYSYISSIIDYIDINFKYNMKISDDVNGNYKYNITATLMANRANNESGTYWTKDYTIQEDTLLPVMQQDSVSINQNVKIDYQNYNQLLIGFKKEYGLAIDGILRINLNVSTDLGEDSENRITKNTVMSIDMPLVDSSIDIKFNTNENSSNTGVLKYNRKVSDNKIYPLLKFVGISVLILTVIPIAFMIKSIIDKNKRISEYNKKVNKILTTYDSIIVNTKAIKDLSNYNVIKVRRFEELIDAHSEVRMPINYVEIKKNQYSMFILINNNVAWIYRIKDVPEDDEE